ncbi:Fucose permease [Sinosporangium album]|uniref:Fucose permease n=1 Tax=Sinosporangium album TaxID=504805 RepID=A0A1G8F649_9ACTN|nr:MFS transporter [Sinosporangium album]SDH77591.1 Fucose permease [Sinosporangium album]
MTRPLRTARTGTLLTFVLAGLLCGTFTVRIPAIAEKLELTESSIGIALLTWGLGALVTMQAMRGIMTRAGSRSVLRIAGPLCAAALVLLAFAPTFPLLLAAVALFGMAFGAVDIAMNAQGSTVERSYGRPVMNSMHAGWCVGAISAGLLGTAAIAARLPFAAHVTLVSLVSLPMLLLIGRTYLTDAQPAAAAAGTRTRHRLPPIVYLLGAIAFFAFMIEGTVADWNGLFLRNTLGAPEAVAALGYPIFEAGMLASRLAADRLRARFGARGLIAVSGVASAVTFGVVVGAGNSAVALTAIFFVGVAVAAVSPLALSLAGTATANPGPAIAQTGAMGYAGLLLGPVVIGFLSDAATLRVALGVAVVLGVLIAVAARLLPRTDRLAELGESVEPLEPADSLGSAAPERVTIAA